MIENRLWTSMTRSSRCILVVAGLMLTALCPIACAEQTGAARRVLAADSSAHRLAIVGADGKLEWEIQVREIHDAQILASGNILLQQGWTNIQEVTPDKRVVWQYDA